VLRAPELDTGLQVGSHKSRVEGQNPFPRLAGHAAFDGAQVPIIPSEETFMFVWDGA